MIVTLGGSSVLTEFPYFCHIGEALEPVMVPVWACLEEPAVLCLARIPDVLPEQRSFLERKVETEDAVVVIGAD